MFLPLLERRRSIRKYTDQPVEPETIDRLMEAALRAPSSRGFNPWQFIAVTDGPTLEALSRAKPHGASFIKGAPLGIVVCADGTVSDVWIEDAAIASILIQLAATSMGLGSCWIQIRGRQNADGRPAQAFIRDLLGIPDHLEVLSIMAVGYPDETKAPRPKDQLQYEKVHREKFGGNG